MWLCQSYEFRLESCGITRTGLPHSEIPGSKRVCRSPSLIATCYVLLRLLSPRHPPCALSSLITNFRLVLYLKRVPDRIFSAFVVVVTHNTVCNCQRTAHCLRNAKLSVKTGVPSRSSPRCIFACLRTSCYGAAFFGSPLRCKQRLVGAIGFEPMTLRLSSACSNQLSYAPARSFEI